LACNAFVISHEPMEMTNGKHQADYTNRHQPLYIR